MTFWAASGFLWQGIALFIKTKIKQSNNKAMCYHILVFTALKERRMASSQKIHKGRCFTFIKGQRDSCFFPNWTYLYYIYLEEAEENKSSDCKSKLPDWLKRKWTSVEKMLFTLILLNILTLVVVSLPYIAFILNGEFNPVRDIKKLILQFTNLKCCIKAKEPLKPLINGVGVLVLTYD